MPVPNPASELGVLRADDPNELCGQHLLHHDQPGRGRENASSPSLIAAATSAIATVASDVSAIT